MKLPNTLIPNKNPRAHTHGIFVSFVCACSRSFVLFIHGRTAVVFVRNNTRGFTLIEIAVVLAIVATLTAIGLTVGIDSYQRFLFRSDLHTAASLLQKARSSAINNIGETNHGVYIDNLGERFVLFRGPSYVTRNTSFDLPVPKNKTVTFTGPSEIIFSPLSGTTTGGAIALTDGIMSTTIEINHEGGINW